MPEPRVEPVAPPSYVGLRSRRIAAALGRVLVAPPPPEPLDADRLAFFRREAEELYWNELDWEELTNEERVVGGHLTEMVFPGLLALIDGLVGGPTVPRHPDAVADILAFLELRYSALSAELARGVDSEAAVRAREMTARLIDLALYRLFRLSPAEREAAERGG